MNDALTQPSLKTGSPSPGARERTGQMVDNDQTTDEATPPAPAAPRRGPGHRGADMRDTVAEMAERAQLISQEAGSKVSSAMKDVISAAAGLAGFAIESARDLVQYMVRRGQMTQEEADKLIREAEDAHSKKPASEKARPTASKIAAEKAAVEKAARDAAAAAAAAAAPPQRPGAFSLRTGGPRPVVKPAPAPAPAPAPPPAPAPVAKAAAATKPAAKAAPPKPAVKAAPAKSAAKAPAKAAAKAPSKGSASKPSAKGSSAKAGAKAAPKPPAKSTKAPVKKKK
jgi:polyhydroxyalkanoate synthesis regulator phasin